MTLQILEHQSLRSFNSFGFDVNARYFTEVKSVEDVYLALQFANKNSLELLLLGGGSNLVFVDDAPGLVLKLAIQGIQLTAEKDAQVVLRVGAGENWHDFVLWCLAKGYYGVENLSLIPGSVGAAPVQNIGAYGVELKDIISSVEVIECTTGAKLTLDRHDCQFGYRESIFKGAARGRYIIVHVNFELSKVPQLNTHYTAIEAELARLGKTADPHTISDVVCSLRRSKLPDPAELGNAGSFFKNPVIPNQQFKSLQAMFPTVVAYPDEPGYTKLAAGWLIDQCGWKGYRDGDVGVHVHQALVLVNYGEGRADQLLALAERIQCSVLDRFSVELEMEPSIYPAP